MHIGRKFLNARICLLDICAELRVRCQLRIAQPIMTDHALFVRVSDRALFQFRHFTKCALRLRPHLR